MSTILLNENIYGVVSGEETFWSVLANNLSDCQAIALADFRDDIEEYLRKNPPEVLIFNSLLGNIKTPPGVKKITLLQDNFVATTKLLPFTLRRWIAKIIKFGGDDYTKKLKKQKTALSNADLVVAVSQDIAKWYEIKAEVIPIGTDTELFRPMEKTFLREKYNIPKNKFVKIYVGSTHPIKGWDLIRKEIERNKDDLYILVLKDEKIPKLSYKNIKLFQRVPQTILAELYNCADLFIGRSRIESLWLAPVEAMFCNIPIDVTPVGVFTDWCPENKNPRQEAFQKGLDQKTMIRKWKDLIESIDKNSERR